MPSADSTLAGILGEFFEHAWVNCLTRDTVDAEFKSALAAVPPAALGSRRQKSIRTVDIMLAAIEQTSCVTYVAWALRRSERLNPPRPREFSRTAKRVLLDAAGRRCQRCGRGGQLRLDHVVAIRFGGTDGLDNGQVLCATCHDAKTSAEPRIEVFRTSVSRGWYVRLLRRGIYDARHACFLPFNAYFELARLGPFGTTGEADTHARRLAVEWVKDLRWPCR